MMIFLVAPRVGHFTWACRLEDCFYRVLVQLMQVVQPPLSRPVGVLSGTSWSRVSCNQHSSLGS